MAQGGDVGAGVTDAMGRQAPEGLVGIHTNLLVPALNDPAALSSGTEQERAAQAAIKTFQTSGNGYFVEQSTRPQTIGYALLDSPVALAAWMIDHDTDACCKISRAFVDGLSSDNLTTDHVLDNVTTYRLTGTGTSAARSYWEAYGPDAPVAQNQSPPSAVRVPAGFTTFPGEIWRTRRSWAEQAYPTLNYFHKAERGGPLRCVGRTRTVRRRVAGRVPAAARRQDSSAESLISQPTDRDVPWASGSSGAQRDGRRRRRTIGRAGR